MQRRLERKDVKVEGERSLEKSKQKGSGEEGNRKKFRAAGEDVAERFDFKCYAIIKKNVAMD